MMYVLVCVLLLRTGGNGNGRWRVKSGVERRGVRMSLALIGFRG